jgi:hypothetical protein
VEVSLVEYNEFENEQGSGDAEADKRAEIVRGRASQREEIFGGERNAGARFVLFPFALDRPAPSRRGRGFG